MSERSVRIEMTGHGKGRVFIDGVEVPRVRAVRFAGEANKANQVTIDVWADVVDITAPANVVTTTATATSTESEEAVCRERDQLRAALTISRGQWIHSVNRAQCLAALGETGPSG